MTAARFAEFKVAVAVAVGAATLEVRVSELEVAPPVEFWVLSPLFTVTVKLPVEPVPVGVPLITPVEVFRLKPAGSDPVRLNVNAPVPVVGMV